PSPPTRAPSGSTAPVTRERAAPKLIPLTRPAPRPLPLWRRPAWQCIRARTNQRTRDRQRRHRVGASDAAPRWTGDAASTAPRAPRREHRVASTAPRAPRREHRVASTAPLPVTEHSRVSPSRLGRNRRYSPVSSHGSRTQCRVLSFRGYVPATRHSSDLSHTIAELPAMTRQTSSDSGSNSSNASGRRKSRSGNRSGKSSNVSRNGTGSTNAIHIDATIRELAARQHGVVAREQLVRVGVPDHKIEYRLKTGRLQRLYRAVYRVGPVAGAREREMAAVLACGETAVLSHDSAAATWELAPAQGD